MTNIPTIRPRQNLKSCYYMENLAIAGIQTPFQVLTAQFVLVLIVTDIEGGGVAIDLFHNSGSFIYSFICV